HHVPRGVAGRRDGARAAARALAVGRRRDRARAVARSMSADVLTNRALNRATLARQLLLERSALAPLRVVEHLVGLQAQEPRDPYVALWTRVEGFTPEGLEGLLLDRSVVRIAVMRSTIHLVTADDALVLPSLVQPVLDAELARHPQFAPHLRDVDL